MENAKIYELVKSIETHFFGYVAKENCLENSSGLKLHFRSSWNGKTTVSGLGGKRNHSIGCSFTKPLDKIAKDIKKRLLPAYRDDFFEKVTEDNGRKEKEASDFLKLEALAEASNGEIRSQYGFDRGPYGKYVSSEVANISQQYNGNYQFIIDADFGEALELLEALRSIFPKRSEAAE